MRPARFGRLKVDSPSPPYVVPMSWKSVSFSAINSTLPSQNAHPAGAKFPANIRISPTYGCATLGSYVSAREDALQRDAPVEHQVRLTVLMRLAAADVEGRRRRERGQVARPAVAV